MFILIAYSFCPILLTCKDLIVLHLILRLHVFLVDQKTLVAQFDGHYIVEEYSLFYDSDNDNFYS